MESEDLSKFHDRVAIQPGSFGVRSGAHHSRERVWRRGGKTAYDPRWPTSRERAAPAGVGEGTACCRSPFIAMTRFFAVVLGGAVTVFALWLVLASLAPPIEAVKVEKIGPSGGPPPLSQPEPPRRVATSAPKPSSPAALPSPISHAEAAP